MGSSSGGTFPLRGGQGVKDAFEARLGKKVPSDHAALAWLVEFVAVLINRNEVAHDGKAPHERLRGKPSKLARVR